MSELKIDHDSWDMAGMQGTGSKTLVRKDPLFVRDSWRVKLAQVAQDTTPGRAIPGNTVARSRQWGGVWSCPRDGARRSGHVRRDDEVEGEDRSRRELVGATSEVQSRVADASARIDAAIALLLTSVEPFEAKVAADDPVTVSERVRIRRNVGFAARQAFQAVNILAEGAGASSFAMKAPFQRYWRDLIVSVRHVTLDTDVIYTMYGQERFGLQPVGSH
jgi:3-hydroxy-9,10-secoandrosta-1,3,5(10)-triene-9,17-dione monooxygenase